MKRTRHATPLLLACLLTIGAAGCSDDVEPRFEPAPTPSVSATSTSPSPSSEPTPIASAVDTVRAWVAAQNTALLTGDAAPVLALSSSDCKTCRDLVTPISDVYQAGGRFETRGWQIDAAKRRADPSSAEQVDAAITIAGGRTFPTADAEAIAYDADKRILRFKVVQVGGERLVSFIGFLS